MIVERRAVGEQVWTDHVVSVPVDHADPAGHRLALYAREVAPARAGGDSLPVLLYLQGGPGGKADRPARDHGWLPRALRDYRVLLMDQRGTGRSTPIDPRRLAACGGPEAQARYLGCFRADAIVQDAELLRRELLGPDGRWSVLGQSFGGWCATTYLSFAPEHLDEVFITGGLPSLTATADDVYRAAYPRVIARGREHFERFPEDRERVAALTEHLATADVRLPRGERLSVRRLQALGIALGWTGGHELLHFLLEDAFPAGTRAPRPGDDFLRGVDAIVSHAGRPLFAALHEAVYCQGAASRWSAHRLRGQHPEIDDGSETSPFFTGEMIFPWMFEEDPTLAPLADAAHLLAERSDWPVLFDPARLARNDVPVVAVVYANDLYVDAEMSLETAAAIRGARTWVTGELEHDALRKGLVLDRVLAMRAGEA